MLYEVITPVATVGINAARNAAILAAQILATSDQSLMDKLITFKEELKSKITKANDDLKAHHFKYRVD